MPLPEKQVIGYRIKEHFFETFFQGPSALFQLKSTISIDKRFHNVDKQRVLLADSLQCVLPLAQLDTTTSLALAPLFRLIR